MQDDPKPFVTALLLSAGVTVVLTAVLVSAAGGAQADPVTSEGAPHGVLWGGIGGAPFVDDLPREDRLTQIRIRSGRYVDAIQVEWGKHVGEHHGGLGGREHLVTLRRGEYVQAISGRSGSYIDAITIHTNQRTYGPFGGGGGSAFRIDAPAGHEIEGFHGGSGIYVDRLGVIVRKR